ncbi:hypothetical protein K1T71_003270 [Dendrolimus kikuchii]|uniref:Uncharacterized protein n=1 Tax=Dendrolimus kikuchii TaxID=765133 RepID=A0ACC1DBF3_9NEOP|nr:hypothetical protein K1T71_003270 [Dendrolimus kikuchii]
MFKKLKDKLAEEVKSSPQRIQQFAQAAQAAVTSASSSISDITNSDLFSIGDNDSQQIRTLRSQTSPNNQQNTFQDVSLLQTNPESTDVHQDILENPRQRRLSNSSFASDISFRLPTYETPSMYHLQSDMDVSASEAEERGLSGSAVSLDRVTKEQLYAAYRRTQERYTKYRTQYGDLARHYKLLERENAKARSVLVETQDKALRRISELKEQCSLEQSAKAHLEKALRVEIEERNMKIEALNTKIQLLQSNTNLNRDDNINNVSEIKQNENDVQLINLSADNETKTVNEETTSTEMSGLNIKIEKMEQLLNKYKESLKVSKEKNSQLSSELQIISNELESKNKEFQQMKFVVDQLEEAKQKIQDINSINEELQNKVNAFDFSKTKEVSTLETDLQKALEEISQLKSKIQIFTKREEEYAISLAENKLSIHKELESKEAEIKSLKEGLSTSKQEIESLAIVINDYKNSISVLEEEKLKLTTEVNDFNAAKTKINELEANLLEISKKCQTLEQIKSKADEEYKCLQLQVKQETAEKLAMVDRNTYLENRNKQLTEENTKKSSQISSLETEIQNFKKNLEYSKQDDTEKQSILEELDVWRDKYEKLELEVQDERDELVKLQAEIEKLITNHESIQEQNSQYRANITELKSENCIIKQQLIKSNTIKDSCQNMANGLGHLKQCIDMMSKETRLFKIDNNNMLDIMKKQIDITLGTFLKQEINLATIEHNALKTQYTILEEENNELKSKITEYKSEIDQLNENLDSIKSAYEADIENIKLLKIQKDELISKLEYLEQEAKHLQLTVNKTNINDTEIKKLEDEHNQLVSQFIEFEKLNIELQTKCNDLENEKESLTHQLLNVKNIELIKNEDMKKLQTDNENLTEKVLDLENLISLLNEKHNVMIKEKETVSNMLTEVEKMNMNLRDEITKLIAEKGTLTSKLIELESLKKTTQLKIKTLEKEKEKLATKLMHVEKANASLQEEINEVDTDKEITSRKLIDLENLKDCLETELEAKKDEIKTLLDDLNGVKKENVELVNLSQEINSKLMHIRTLEESNKSLSEENILLKSQLQNISSDVIDLEKEINDIRQSHEELEREKDHLNDIIEKLENSESNKVLTTTCSKDIQTDILENNLEVNIIETAEKEHFGNLNSANKNVDETEQIIIYNELKADNDILKEENRRLQSDIEGLQTYLAKISKENSVLNDKLRELLATSEHSTENSDLTQNLSDLMNEVQCGKEKIDNLLRENSLLVEENLELKDQLLNQNYSPSVKGNNIENGQELTLLRAKYNNLQQVNNSAENRLQELEQMNKSISANMTQVHEKNEKLKVSNEKLERRLDEALVSLRHLHSLQENTELEYLRNILYEYLTGSGTHSVTLAKVLAAIVKFDDSQTQLVLQKEKERQGFLRQLGLI